MNRCSSWRVVRYRYLQEPEVVTRYLYRICNQWRLLLLNSMFMKPYNILNFYKKKYCAGQIKITSQRARNKFLWSFTRSDILFQGRVLGQYRYPATKVKIFCLEILFNNFLSFVENFSSNQCSYQYPRDSF